MKILPVGAQFFLADGQTDMTKLMAAFRNCANAPKHSGVPRSKSNFCFLLIRVDGISEADFQLNFIQII